MKSAITALMIASCLAPGCQRQGERYAPVPQSLLTPGVVETRLGTLEFFDGFPSAETVEKVYDHLDFMRGVRAFLDAIPIASLYAMREGFRDVGCVNGTVGIFEELMDSKTLFPHAKHRERLCHDVARPEGRPGRRREPAQYRR